MGFKRVLLIINIVCFAIFADEQVRILDESIKVSADFFEVVDNKTFFNDFNKDIVACSPGIQNMMTYSEICKDDDGKSYNQELSWYIGKENHPFVSALYFAFANHKKITITPDMIWLLVCQGASTHINLNSKKYRHYFTKNMLKQKIGVRVDSLTLEFNDPNWLTAISLITDSLSKFLKPELFNIYNPTFITTKPEHKAAFQLTLMNAVKEYYEYNVLTACGIPEIIISGKREDWVWIYESISHFDSLDLEWWTKELKPVLKQFVNAFNGNIDKEFWCSILKDRNSSGAPLKINGWVKNLFPYVLNEDKKFVRNIFIGDGNASPKFSALELSKFKEWQKRGLKIAAFSTGKQETPFVWEMLNERYKMIFYSGFLGISYNHSEGMLIPQVGYLIGKDEGDI